MPEKFPKPFNPEELPPPTEPELNPEPVSPAEKTKTARESVEGFTEVQRLEYLLQNLPGNLGESPQRSEEAREEKMETDKEPETLPTLEPLPEPSTFPVEGEQPEKQKPGLAEGPLRNANFKVEDALNNEEFLQFLSNYEDAREMDPLTHQREIEKRFDLFEAQKTLGKDLVDFYKREVGEKLGLPIDEEGERAIAEAVRKEAMERPEELIKKGREKHGYESLKKELENYDQLLSSIGGAKNRDEALQKLKAEEASLKKKKMTQEWSVGFWKFINPETNPLLDFWFRRGMMTEGARTWQKDIQKATKAERAKLFDATDKEIEKIAEQRKELKDWDEAKMRERFDELRHEVFEKFEPTKALFGWMQKKTADTVESLLRKPKKGEKEISLKNIEDARKFIGKLKLGREKFGSSAFATSEHFEAEAQEQLKNLVEALLHKHIAEMKITNKPLDGLMGKIRELVAKEKDPVKKGLMTTAMISSLEKAIANIKDNTKPPFKSADTAKLLLLQMAWHKLVESVRESS